MKIQLAAATVLALASVPPTPASSASAVPRLDVKTTCSEAQAVTGETQSAKRGAAAANRQTFNACMQDEKRAQDELATKWTSFKPNDQASCVQAGAAPNPSYVELLTCLEMSTPSFSGKPDNANPPASTPRR